MKTRKPVSRRLSSACAPVFEAIESRIMMSTTVAAWNFDGLTAGVNYTPAPSTGVGTASSVGMTTDSTGASGPYPITKNAAEGNLSEGPDQSTIENDTGSSDTTTVNPENWKIVGTKTTGNGWNYLAPIGSQGAQFLVSTVGYTSIQLSFDWGVSGFTANGQLAVEYTLNGGTSWLPAPAIALGSTTNAGTGAGDTAVMNGSGANFVNGPYFQDQGNTHGGSNDWQNGLTADFSSVAGAGNNSGFGVRLVNAATGSTAVLSAAGTGLPSQTSANWRFDDIQIVGTQSSAAPTITTQPTNQTTPVGGTATFTAAANGSPTPTVQWYTGTPTGTNAPISGATSPSYTTPAETLAQSGTTFYAVFTNSQGSATTSTATLTVTASPQITTQPTPTSQYVIAGTSITYTAAASGTPTPTVQWQISTDGTTYTNIAGATSGTYTFNALESETGDQFRAVFTNNAGTATTNPVSLTVLGEPIAQWIFTQGEAPTPESQEFAGDGNSPLATLDGPSPDTSAVIGLGVPGAPVDYTGVPQYAESDIIAKRSTINSNYDPYVWRVRAGSGLGPTGSPGSPEGWSQLAPEYSQGVQFMVSTVGYSNITLHFDWNGGGIADMQPQYTPDGGSTWIDVPGGVVQNFTSDYLGITSTTTPTGVLVNLQGITAANNNPNFGIRLVAAYDPALPNIVDGNQLDPTSHGQYASSTAAAQDAEQILDIGGQPGDNTYSNVSGGTFTLSFGGQTTAPIAYNATPAAVQAALAALSTIGTGNVAVTNTMITPYTATNTASYTIKFQGTLKDAPESLIAVNSSGLTGSVPSAYVQNYVIGTAASTGVTPYQDGSGAWSLGNFSFNGDVNPSAVITAPGIASNPTSETVVATIPTTVSFTASAYSETTPASVLWQVSTNGGSSWSTAPGTANSITGTGPVYSSSYSYSTTYPVSAEGTTDLYRAVFTNPNGSTDTQNAALSIVAPVAPVVTTQPLNVSVQQGNVAVFTAAATGSPTPTVQWQDSTDGGVTWNNVVNTTGSSAITGATTDSLYFTTTNDTTESGYEFRAVFTNVVQATDTNAVTLTVLSNETVITDWDFSQQTYSSGQSVTYINNPAPYIGSGTASLVGMTLPYNPSDPATGTDGNGSVADGDITTTAGSLNPNFSETTWRIRGGIPTYADVNGVETVVGATGGTPANGWSNLVSQYTQGVEFDVNTTGYTKVYATMDWYSTTSGELDAREQYTTDGGQTWYNLDDHQPASVYDPNPTIQAVSNDFYGATATGNPIPLVFDLTSVASAANDSGFGIRLVNAYDAYLSNTQSLTIGYGDTSNFTLTYNGQTTGTILYNANYATLASNIQTALGSLSQIGAANVSVAPSSTGFTITFGGTFANHTPAPLTIDDFNPAGGGDTVVANDQYANALLVGTPAVPAPYNGSKGNWRFDNIVVHGVASFPAWLASNSIATWNSTTHSLVVSGASEIIGDPGTDEPQITFTGTGDVLTINTGSTRTVNIGSLAVTGGNSVVMTSGTTTHILIDQGALTTSAGNTLDIGNNFLDLPTASLTAIDTQIAAGSIISSDTTAGSLGTIGAINGSSYTGTFDTITPGAADVLVRYTYYGDANLDGRVDGSDYTKIDAGFNSGLTGWANGDFNYDQVVDGSDYTLIDNAFNTQGLQLSPTAQIAAGAAIPSNNYFSSSTQPIGSDFWKKDQASTLVSVVDSVRPV